MASSAIGTPIFLAKVQNLTDNDGTSFSQFIPSGVVLPFAGTTAPAGFLLCNGATVSRTTYSKLFAAIGSAHGAGDGSTTFHLPDYRGRFLRGQDGGVARDPDRAGRAAANSGGATGDNVGSVQGNATAKNGLGSSSQGASANHTHTVSHGHGIKYGGTISGAGQWIDAASYFAGGISGTNASYGTNTYTGALYSYITSDSPTSSGHSADHSHTITTSGDNETRPVNANVNYIIKI